MSTQEPVSCDALRAYAYPKKLDELQQSYAMSAFMVPLGVAFVAYYVATALHLTGKLPVFIAIFAWSGFAVWWWNRMWDGYHVAKARLHLSIFGVPLPEKK